MATSNGQPKVTISASARVKLTVWLVENREKLATVSASEAAELFFRETGTPTTAYHVEKVAAYAGVALAKVNRKRGGYREPKSVYNKVRCLANHVKYLYEQLQVPVPDSLITLSKGLKLEESQAKLFDDQAPAK